MGWYQRRVHGIIWACHIPVYWVVYLAGDYTKRYIGILFIALMSASAITLFSYLGKGAPKMVAKRWCALNCFWYVGSFIFLNFLDPLIFKGYSNNIESGKKSGLPEVVVDIILLFCITAIIHPLQLKLYSLVTVGDFRQLEHKWNTHVPKGETHYDRFSSNTWIRDPHLTAYTGDMLCSDGMTIKFLLTRFVLLACNPMIVFVYTAKDSAYLYVHYISRADDAYIGCVIRLSGRRGIAKILEMVKNDERDNVRDRLEKMLYLPEALDNESEMAKPNPDSKLWVTINRTVVDLVPHNFRCLMPLIVEYPLKFDYGEEKSSEIYEGDKLEADFKSLGVRDLYISQDINTNYHYAGNTCIKASNIPFLPSSI